MNPYEGIRIIRGGDTGSRMQATGHFRSNHTAARRYMRVGLRLVRNVKEKK
jgi:hypothetical protein